MKPIYPVFILAALFPMLSAAVGCDPADDDQAIEMSEDELDMGDENVDEQVAPNDVKHGDNLAAQAPDPLAGYWDCPASASFCFWGQPNYGGQPLAFPAGDFAINFGTPVRSMMKRTGTYRVKLYSKPNFKGDCKVFGLPGEYAASPNLFEVRSARRMEPAEGGCP